MKTISDYILRQRIDTVGLVSRYSCIKRSVNTPVTLHVVSKKHIHDSGIHEKVKHEYELARRIKSPYVIKYLDIVETDSVMAVVTEALPVMSLRSYLAVHTDVDLEKTIEIITKISMGLNSCHHHGIIHRDIRPENIYVDTKGDIKIANFGLSTLSSTTTLTLTGTLFGDPAYTPPENLYAEQKSLQGDIYSVGIILYEMLVGHNPFEGYTITEIIHAKSEQSLTPPSAIVPNLPGWMDVLTLKMTASSTEQRPSSLVEVISSLQSRSHPKVTKMNSGKSCAKCGFSLLDELPFCSYCGAKDNERSADKGGQVMVLKNVKNLQATEDILHKTFSVDASCNLKKALGKKIIPVLEDTSDDQDPWLDEQLRKAGVSVDYIPMDVWYIKLSSFIIFCILACPVIYWSMTGLWHTTSDFDWVGFKAFRYASFLIPTSLIFLSILILAFLCIKSIKRHYAPMSQIPISFAKGVLSSGSIIESTRLIQSLLMPCVIFVTFLITVAGAIILTCRIVYFTALMSMEYIQTIGSPAWYGGHSVPPSINVLIHLGALIVVRIFIGTIYIRPLFTKKDQTLLSKASEEFHNNSIYIKFEKIRLLSKTVEIQMFRYAIADLLAYYLSFAALLRQSPYSSDELLLADFNKQMETSIESALTIGNQIKRLSLKLSELNCEKAKKKLEQLQCELNTRKQDPPQLIKDELRKAQETIIDHESVSEVLFVSLNILNQIVGGVKALTLQLNELINESSCNLNDVKMNLAMLSENLNSLNISKRTSYESF